LAVGTPVVVPEELGFMAGIVRGDDLGVVARSTKPADLARAIVTALERLAVDPDWRSRIAATALERFIWPVAAAPYADLVRSISGAAR
jgi:glycogen synthase